MNTLKNFLHPVRKPNTKFVLSDAFVNDEGKPLEWEMRQIGAKEGVELARETEGMAAVESMLHYVAASLVVPNLKSQEIVNAFAEERNGKIMSPAEILSELVTDGELGKLIDIYSQHNRTTLNFAELVEEAKN